MEPRARSTSPRRDERQRPPSSRDIAREAGVSQSTVSRVLNKSPSISPATVARVEAAMAKLGYSRNAAARTLITGRSNLIGLVVSNIANPFYPEVIEAIVATAAQQDYNVILCNTQEDPALQLAYLDLLLEHQVDGAILTSSFMDAGEQLEQVVVAGTPLVLVNRTSTDSFCDSVHLDNEKAGHLATAHLLDLGHERVGYIGGHQGTSTNQRRFDGYVRAHTERGLEVERRLVQHGQFTAENGRRQAARLLVAQRPPTALVCADDLIAMGAMDAVLDAGLTIPGDVAVVGFDDIPAAALRQVSLTTIRQPAAEMGRRAVELLLDRITGQDDGRPVEVVLRPELVVRDTCGASAGRPGPRA